MLMDKVVGIDIGGTFIKGGLVNENGEMLSFSKIETPTTKDMAIVCENIAKLVDSLCNFANIQFKELKAVGVACAGAIDSEKGTVIVSSNLGWHNVQLKTILEERLKLPVAVCNDADAAMLAEVKFGVGKGCDNVILLTLGTGVGSGVWKDGRLLDRVELGHVVIENNGRQCICGRKGCFETYASASGLVRAVISAVKEKDTQMKAERDITGKTAFLYYDKDSVARKVLDEYFNHLVCGIVNCANIFQSEMIVLGGGICKSLEKYIPQLELRVNQEAAFPISLKIAHYGNCAGVIGATALWR